MFRLLNNMCILINCVIQKVLSPVLSTFVLDSASSKNCFSIQKHYTVLAQAEKGSVGDGEVGRSTAGK